MKTAYQLNREKRWRRECGRRKSKLQKMSQLPPPTPGYCTEGRNELLDAWNGLKRTRTSPHIYYRPVQPKRSVPKAGDFNRYFREMFVKACTPHTEKLCLKANFITMPSFEGKVCPRVEPTAKTGYVTHKRNERGEATTLELLHVKFWRSRMLARELRKPHPRPKPAERWWETSRMCSPPGKCRKLDTRFRIPGADEELRERIKNDPRLILRRRAGGAMKSIYLDSGMGPEEQISLLNSRNPAHG